MLTARTTAIRRSIVTPPCPFAPAAYCKIRAVGSVPEHFNAAAFFVDRHLAEGRGAQTAFRFAGRGISYADLAASVDRCANGLAGLGVEIEHRVVLALNDSPAFAAAFWGTTKLGAVAVPVNTLMTPAEYEFLLTDSRARVAIVEPPVAGRLLAVRHRCPSLRAIIVVGGPALPGTHDFDELLAGAKPTCEPAPTVADDICYWGYTSGSTGKPKAAVHSHAHFLAAADLVGVAVFGLELVEVLGSTEALHEFSANAPGAARGGSVGRPVPGFEARLVDDAGAPVPDGVVGHLLIKGPTTSPYYWNRRERTQATMLGPWLHTGDMLARDADGFYMFAGRGDDMLKVAGMWVSPADIYAALMEHRGVLEAGVVGQADADGLTRPHAVVVLKDGWTASPDLAATLIEFVARRAGSHRAPATVAFADELPKTATGKVQRFRLRQR